MCGIAGFAGQDASTASGLQEKTIVRMLDRIVHRGPDSAGVFSEDDVTLGFRRLAIMDLEGGDQPLFSEDGAVVLVCNGEIFNHRELRHGLMERGHVFATRSDVEVLIHLYEEHGAEFVHHLNGQFAFALFDRRDRMLILGRDPTGIAPMFHAQRDGCLVFGSEVKAMLPHPAIARRVDLTGLDQVMCFPGLVSPRTMFDGVQALPPGSLLMWKDGRARIQKYWDFDFAKETASATPACMTQWQDRLYGLFASAVQRRLEADVPVGLYLSGGLDSSMIACMAARLTTSRLATFSIVFDDPAITETKYQRLVARTIRSDHHEIRFTPGDLLDNLRSVIYHSECPVKETYNACSYLLSRETRAAGIKAILTGEGADEMFAGYPSYKFAALNSRLGVQVSLEERRQRERLFGIDVPYEKRYLEFGAQRLRLYSARARELLSAGDALGSRLVDPALLQGRDAIHQRAYLDCKLRLADHLLTEHGDRMLLAHSVEGRYPFLDREFVDAARELPSNSKLVGLEEKFILKEIAKGFVPPEIVRREKYGFHAPSSPWLLKHGGDWVRELLSNECLRRHGVFDPGYVAGLVQRYSRPDFSLDARMEDDLLMIVLSFGIFMEAFDMPGL